VKPLLNTTGRLLEPRTLPAVILGYLDMFVTIKCPNDHRLTVIIDDLGRWRSCGIPSVWRSPTARQPGGSPRRDRYVPRVALSPGWRVVAPEGGRRDATPFPPRPAAAVLAAIPEVCPPSEGTVVTVF
jgi:hypothetical protein